MFTRALLLKQTFKHINMSVNIRHVDILFIYLISVSVTFSSPLFPVTLLKETQENQVRS